MTRIENTQPEQRLPPLTAGRRDGGALLSVVGDKDSCRWDKNFLPGCVCERKHVHVGVAWRALGLSYQDNGKTA